MQVNKNILIVDDEETNLKILNLRLSPLYQVEQAKTGEEALEKLKTFTPAVILLDIMMPGIDGLEVTRQVRALSQHEHCKIVLVTGKAREEEKLAGYDAGADDYVTKPFNGKEITAKVKVLVDNFNLNKNLEEQVKLRTLELLKSQKLATIGMNSAEIVHNLKGPLTVIKGYVSMLKNKNVEPKMVGKIDEATVRLLEILKNLLKPLSQDSHQEDGEYLVNDIIQSELSFVVSAENLPQDSVTLDLKSEQNLSRHGNYMAQVIGNLLKNAGEALKDQKQKKIEISSEDKGKFCEVTITDNGPGMTKEVLDRVFDPFFTTKQDQGLGQSGSGLGLSFCKKIMESIGGEIHLESIPQEKTTFLLRIPF